MVVMVVCGALLAVGIAVAVGVAGGSSQVASPPSGPSRADRLRRTLWWIEVVLATAVLSGITVVGAGGRLAMRLLGATAGSSAQGRFTEAEEAVGEITVGGTVAFVLFVGLAFGLGTTLAYLAVRHLLPVGRLGGLVFGAALLVVGGTRIEPLRPDSRDFDLLGPWWLAVLVFAALALLQGAAIAGFAGAVSRWLPLPGRDPRSAAYVLLVLLVPVFPLGIAALVGIGAVLVAAEPLARAQRWLASPGPLLVGRAVLVLAVLVALPGFVTAIGDLVGRGPGT